MLSAQYHSGLIVKVPPLRCISGTNCVGNRKTLFL